MQGVVSFGQGEMWTRAQRVPLSRRERMAMWRERCSTSQEQQRTASEGQKPEEEGRSPPRAFRAARTVISDF